MGSTWNYGSRRVESARLEVCKNTTWPIRCTPGLISDRLESDYFRSRLFYYKFKFPPTLLFSEMNVNWVFFLFLKKKNGVMSDDGPPPVVPHTRVSLNLASWKLSSQFFMSCLIKSLSDEGLFCWRKGIMPSPGDGILRHIQCFRWDKLALFFVGADLSLSYLICALYENSLVFFGFFFEAL